MTQIYGYEKNMPWVFWSTDGNKRWVTVKILAHLLRMAMESKYLVFRRWLYTPIITWQGEPGSLGVFFQSQQKKMSAFSVTFTPPLKLTCPLKGTISIGNTSSNHWFSTDMLVFRGVFNLSSPKCAGLRTSLLPEVSWRYKSIGRRAAIWLGRRFGAVGSWY